MLFAGVFELFDAGFEFLDRGSYPKGDSALAFSMTTNTLAASLPSRMMVCRLMVT